MNGIIDANHISYDTLGMKQVFLETAAAVEKKYREHIEVPYMQYILKSGLLQGYDRKTHSTVEIDISGILEEMSKTVCHRAIDKLRAMYNNLLDLDYLIVTGGTGEAWWNIIQDEFKGVKTLKVLSGNENSSLPFTFSNVRVYYFFLYRSLKKRSK